MRRPGILNGSKMTPRALGNFGQAGNYNLASAVDYRPPWQGGMTDQDPEFIKLTNGNMDPNFRDGKAKEIAQNIKTKIEGLIAKAQAAGDTATAQEMQNIYKEAQQVWATESTKTLPYYPATGCVPMWRKAEKLVDDLAMWIKTPVVAAAASNAVSSVIPNSGSSADVYDTPSVSSDSSKTILMVGGLGLGLLVLLMVSRILKRKKTAAPAARRKKKK